MPPFCAPTPPCLLSESAAEGSPPAERVDNDDDERAQMVASLVTALTDAAAAVEESNVHNLEQRSMLARQAYVSLCFDFPIVSTSALAALASAFRSSPLGLGASPFPITEKFTSGLRYLVSVELTKKRALDGQEVVGDMTTVVERESIADEEFRQNCAYELCGCVFLLAPALRLAQVHRDDGASLQEFLAAYDLSLVNQSEHSQSPDTATAPNFSLAENVDDKAEMESKVQDSAISDEGEAEIYDDDSDWEALETFTPPSEALVSQERTIPRNVETSERPILMSKLAMLTGSVPTEVIRTGVWEELQLTHHLTKALNCIRMVENKEADVDGSATAKLYAEILSERLLFTWSTSSSEVTQVVSALMALGGARGEKIKEKNSSSVKASPTVNAWHELILSTLARLCSKVGGYPPRQTLPTTGAAAPFEQTTSTRRTKDASLPSPAFVRCLWQSVYSNMEFLQCQMTETLGGSESTPQLEMVFTILCFMVKCAPGNVDLRATFLEGGIFRIALQMFVSIGCEPNMEPLRHFLLLSMASSSALSEFAAQVPSFLAAMSAVELVEGSATGAYCIIWPLILRAVCGQLSTSGRLAGQQPNRFKSTEAEAAVVTACDGVVEGVAEDSITTSPHFFVRKLLWVHRLLVLLEEVTCIGLTFKLWQFRSPLDRCMGRLQVALGSLSGRLVETGATPTTKFKATDSEDVADTVVSPEDKLGHSLPSEKSAEKSLEHSVADAKVIAVQGKVKELVPSMLVRLKLLSALTNGNREAKID